MIKYIKRTYLIFCVMFLLQLTGYSQEKAIKNLKIATYFGFRDIQRDSFPNKENIDFMNYMYSEKDYLDYKYLGFSAQFDFKENWKADIKMSMLDDFIPNNFNITVQYFPLESSFGIDFGCYGNTQIMNEFSTFHKLTDIGFEDNFINYAQSHIFDYGIICGVVLNKKIWKINTVIKINSGLGTTKPFKESISQKQIDANYRRKIEYNTKNNFELFLFPEIEIGIDCIKLNNKILGIQFQSSWFYSHKSINYEKVVCEWTTCNCSKYQIQGDKHNYSKYEADFGIYLRW